jgi:hypothetical protein
MIKRILTSIVMSAIALSVIVSPILAALYSAKLTLTNGTATSYAMYPALLAMDNALLVSSNYIAANGLNVNVTNNSVAIPTMLVDDKTLFAMPMAANTVSNPYYNVIATPNTSMPIITGLGGYVTTADDAALELGNNFLISFGGYIDATSGANKDIFYKADAFRIYISSDNHLRAAMLSGGDVEELAITYSLLSGEHIVQVWADGQWIGISVDGDTSIILLNNNTIPDNANNIILLRNNVMPYCDYITVGV